MIAVPSVSGRAYRDLDGVEQAGAAKEARVSA